MALNFPHIRSTGQAPSASEIYSANRQLFKQHVSEGLTRPIVFPYNFSSIFLLVAYLCIPHKQNSIIYAMRWPLVGFITWFELRVMQETSGVAVVSGYNTGIFTSIVIMMSWTWLIFKRPQWDAKRVERRKIRVVATESKTQSTGISSCNEGTIQEKRANGPISLSKEGCCEVRLDNGEAHEYYWQSYPENFKERLLWVADLVLNFRGPGWNWSISTIPRLTPEVQSRLAGSFVKKSQPNIKPIEKKRLSGRYKHLLSQVSMFLKCSIIVDVLKTAMMKDPYFKLGPTSYDLPSYLWQLHPSVLQLYRLLLTGCSLVAGLSMASTASSIFLSCVLGPNVLGLRGEHWYYPDLLEKFSVILDNGLGGLWGTYWHQSFRLYFTAPTKYLIQEGYIRAGRLHTKVIGLSFAFSISGFMHWAGSMTSFGPSSPTHEGLFFLLQGVGVIFQEVFSSLFSSFIVKLPKSLRQIGNLFFTLGWLYLTGWLVADDFARTGIWLIDMFPFSPTQALGLGENSAGWNSVKSFDFDWYTGKYWWESGFTLL